MGLWDKFFGRNKGQKPEGKSRPQNHDQLPWIEARDNPWGIRLLDLRPISQHMLSSSKDPEMAANAISYSQDDGLTFLQQVPLVQKSINTNFSFSIDHKLEHGVLFIPSTMEHKWAIYFHENKLLFIRSWLRQVVVVAETLQKDNELIVQRITGEFTEEESPKFTEAILKFLIHSHVLNEVVPAPIPKALQENLEAAGMWAFSTYGNMAHLGHFESEVAYQTEFPLRSHSLLHIAIARGDLAQVEAELQTGANINALAGDGLSTLQWAMATDPNILEYLLETGADPNTLSTEGATPIMSAVQSNKLAHLNLLISYKGNVNAQDYRGFTALHRAAEMGHIEITKALLEQGADKNIASEGHTALSLAEARNNVEIIKILA